MPSNPSPSPLVTKLRTCAEYFRRAGYGRVNVPQTNGSFAQFTPKDIDDAADALLTLSPAPETLQNELMAVRDLMETDRLYAAECLDRATEAEANLGQQIALFQTLRAQIEALRPVRAFPNDETQIWDTAIERVLQLLTPDASEAARATPSDGLLAAQAEEEPPDFQRGVLAERERIAQLAERTQVGMNSLRGFAATIREGPDTRE